MLDNAWMNIVYKVKPKENGELKKWSTQACQLWTRACFYGKKRWSYDFFPHQNASRYVKNTLIIRVLFFSLSNDVGVERNGGRHS